MADNNAKDTSENCGNFRKNPRSINENEISDDDQCQGASSAVGPDIGLGEFSPHNRNSAELSGHSGSNSSSDAPRREENPFSFKHFLNRDSSGGVRPKVFPVKSPPAQRIMNNSELTSGLPDFVQDHLVIEQCYLNQPSQHLSVDMNNLVELGLESPNEKWNSRRVGDLPFDLTATRHEWPSEPPPALPLDLPERPNLPFDLPSQHPSGDVGASTSLPDFLSDGPIHSGHRSDSALPSEPTSPVIPPQNSHLQMLQIENERLRRDKEMIRGQLTDQIRRNELLEGELKLLHSRDHRGTASLESAVRQFEESLSRADRRAEAAELKAAKLKQEVKFLTMELNEMRGACGPSNDQASDHHLAAQLRAAVSSAEHSLRKMLSGVDTLRVIASTLEHRHRFEDQPEFPETENQDDSGPAL